MSPALQQFLFEAERTKVKHKKNGKAKLEFETKPGVRVTVEIDNDEARRMAGRILNPELHEVQRGQTSFDFREDVIREPGV